MRLQRMTAKQAAAHDWRSGDFVLYSPDGAHAFGAVVECAPWALGSGHRVVNLCGLGPEYRACTGVTRSRVNAAFCGALRPAPTEWIDGEWIVYDDPEGPDTAAVITYATEPSTETGHVGWCWWALGKMGDAESYEQARLAAEAVISARLASTRPAGRAGTTPPGSAEFATATGPDTARHRQPASSRMRARELEDALERLGREDHLDAQPSPGTCGTCEHAKRQPLLCAHLPAFRTVLADDRACGAHRRRL